MKLFNPKEIPELERLKKENSELRNTIHTILSKHDTSSELEEKIIKLTEKLSLLSKEEQRIEDFIKSSTDEKPKEIFEINKQMSKLSQQKEQLEENVEAIKNSKDILTRKHGTSEARLVKVLPQIEKKDETLIELEGRIDRQNEVANRLKDEIIRGEGRVAELKKTDDELTTQIKESEKKAKELESIINEKEEHKTKVELDSEAAQKSFAVLTNKKEMLANEVVNLESKIKDAKEANNTISTRLKHDEEIRRNMQTNIAELIGELNLQEKKFKNYEVQKNEFIDDIAQKRNELDNVKFEIENRNEILKDLVKEIEALTEQKRKAKVDVDEAQRMADDIKRSLIRKKEEEDSYGAKLEKLKNEILDFEEKKFKVEENILKLESSFTDTTAKFTEEINEAKTKLTSVKQQIIEKDRDFNKKEQLLLGKNTQLAEYTAMVKLLRKEKEGIERKLHDLNLEKEAISEKNLILREKESERKLTVEKYQTEIQDLVKKRESISHELSSLIEKSNHVYIEYNNKNKLLVKEIEEKENTINNLSENINDLELALVKFRNDISKAELEKERYSTNISQLITMEKTFKEKIATYKKELERIEKETIGGFPAQTAKGKKKKTNSLKVVSNN